MNLGLHKYLSLLVLLLLGVSANLYPQTTLCDIKLTNGKMMSKTRMVGLHDNLLLVSDTNSFKIINVEKVANVRFDIGNYMKTGAGIGAIVGFVGGLVYYEIFNGTKKKKLFFPKDPTLGTVFVFTLPCAIIGGLVGLLFRNVDDYDLSQLNSFTKSKELNFIMKDHEIYR